MRLNISSVKLPMYHRQVAVPPNFCSFRVGFSPCSFKYGRIILSNAIYEGGIITNELGVSSFHGQGSFDFLYGVKEFGTYNNGKLTGPATLYYLDHRSYIGRENPVKFRLVQFPVYTEVRENGRLLSTVTKDLTCFNPGTKTITGSRDILIEALCNVESGWCSGNGFEVGVLAITDALSVESLPFMESAVVRHTSMAMEVAGLLQDVTHGQLASAIDQRYAHPAVFIGGWKHHQIAYVLYRNTIYVCNRGDGAPPSTQRPGLCKSIVPVTLPASEIWPFLLALATIDVNREGPQKLADIWHSYAHKMHNRGTKIRGVHFEKRAQIIPNCWLYSSRTAAILVLGIYADKLGVPFEALYRQTLSTEAMINRQLSMRDPVRFGDFDPSITPDSKLGQLIKARLPHFKFS